MPEKTTSFPDKFFPGHSLIIYWAIHPTAFRGGGFLAKIR